MLRSNPFFSALLAIVALAGIAMIAWRLRSEVDMGPPGSAAALVNVRRAHPCVDDGTERAHLPSAHADVDVVALRRDAGTRLYVADTAAQRCLGMAVRGAVPSAWTVYVADSVRAAFVRTSDATDGASAARAIVESSRHGAR